MVLLLLFLSLSTKTFSTYLLISSKSLSATSMSPSTSLAGQAKPLVCAPSILELVRNSIIAMKVYADMAVKTCHQPCNSGMMPQGIPTACFQGVSMPQKCSSIFQRNQANRALAAKYFSVVSSSTSYGIRTSCKCSHRMCYTVKY